MMVPATLKRNLREKTVGKFSLINLPYKSIKQLAFSYTYTHTHTHTHTKMGFAGGEDDLARIGKEGFALIDEVYGKSNKLRLPHPSQACNFHLPRYQNDQHEPHHYILLIKQPPMQYVPVYEPAKYYICKY